MCSGSLPPIFLVRPMVWGVLREDGKGRRVRRNTAGQLGFHGSELRVIDEVFILIRIILEIIELLETVTIADEPIALIGHPVGRSFFIPKLEGTEGEALTFSARIFEL